MKHLVQINFKSGNTLKMWFTNFTVKNDNEHVTNVYWTCAHNEKILLISVDEIESVVVLKTKKSFWELIHLNR